MTKHVVSIALAGGSVAAIGAVLIALGALGPFAGVLCSLGVLTLVAGAMRAYDRGDLHSVVASDAVAREPGAKPHLVAIALNVFTLFCLSLSVFVLLGWLREADIARSTTALGRLTLGLAATLTILAGLLQARAARLPSPPFVPLRSRILARLVAVLAGFLALVVAAVAFPATRSIVPGALQAADVPVLVLASAAATIVALGLMREVPNPYQTLASPRFQVAAARGTSQTVSLLLTFALVVLLVPLIAWRWLSDLPNLGGFSASVVALVMSGFIAIALLGVAVLHLVTVLGRRPTLYRRTSWADTRTASIVLAMSAILTIIFVAGAVLLATGSEIFGLPQWRWVDSLALALICASGPYGLYISHNQRWSRKVEDGFPDFVRDLASSRKTGLPLPKAVVLASRSQYGAIDSEILRMRSQLLWNVPFEEVMRLFAERVKTGRIQRAVAVLQQAEKLGGNISEVLSMTARNTRELKVLENERRVSMVLYVVIIYLAFFVFLGIVAVLYSSLVPAFSEAAAAAAATPNAPVLIRMQGISQYRTFYFVASIIQAVGNGMLAGVIQEGRASAGLQHAFVMMLLAFVTFGVVL
ncbi:MAG TPA: type II secretion system F family protein [Candidatus Thermoplasmatota archaeon]|nr:type II secretion system F family protein [Candidatus Thermoplasmatota archaeon]